MDTTRASLIIKIKDRSNTKAWREFDALYGPLLLRYARARGMSREDAEEVRNECLTVVVDKIVGFEYEKAKGGFKNWLRRIAYHKIMDIFRKQREVRADTQDFLALADEAPSPDEVWEHNWQHSHLRYCVEQVRSEVSPQTYRAFHMLVFDERSVQEVGDELGMNANMVYKAKSKVLLLIRDKMRELGLDE